MKLKLSYKMLQLPYWTQDNQHTTACILEPYAALQFRTWQTEDPIKNYTQAITTRK
jgi:hypothetical protein